MLPIIQVNLRCSLQSVIKELREAARQETLTAPPQYSSSPEEAQRKARPHTNNILSDGKTRLLQLPSGDLIVVALSVDMFPPAPCWHLSLSMQSPTGFLDVPNSIADWVAEEFGVSESGPEGALPKVRHFRSSYLPD